MKLFKYLLFLFIFLFPSITIPQTVFRSLTLLWDYSGSDHDGFELTRKVGLTGTYEIINSTIPPTALTVVDSQVPQGQLVCYTLYATLISFRSDPSNEACGIALLVPTRVRIK